MQRDEIKSFRADVGGQAEESVEPISIELRAAAVSGDHNLTEQAALAALQAENPHTIIIPLQQFMAADAVKTTPPLKHQETFLTVSEETPGDRPAALNPATAFQCLLDETVLAAASKHYQPPNSFFRALLDTVLKDGKFSWQLLLILGSALGFGAIAAMFALKPAKNAVELIDKILQTKVDKSLPVKHVFVIIAQSANCGRSALIVSHVTYKMINTYLAHTTPAEQVLKFDQATACEYAVQVGRKFFDLAASVAANIPVFLLSRSLGTPLAVLTSLANVSFAWLGMQGLTLNPKTVHPAKVVELVYLEEQLQTFLKLDLQEQMTILKDLAALEALPLTSEKHRLVYLRIFNLANPTCYSQTPCTVELQAQREREVVKHVGPILTGIAGVVSQLPFAEASGVGVAKLFKNPKSPGAASAGVIAALLSLLPCVGFGYRGGKVGGGRILSDEIALATLFQPRTRAAFKYLLLLLNPLAGGTSFYFSYQTCQDVAKLFHMSETLADFLKGTYISIATIGTNVAMGNCLLNLLDDVCIYFAERCADIEVKRLFHFVLSMRHFQHVFAYTNNESYLTILRWKLEGNTLLSKTMAAALKERLTPGEYRKTQEKVNLEKILLPNPETLEQYQLVPSFFAKEAAAKSAEQPGLRRRFVGC